MARKKISAEFVSTYQERTAIGGVKIGLISDTHYNEGGGNNEDDIPGGAAIKNNTDTAISTFNNEGVDAVVHVGDAIDGAHHYGVTQSTWESWQSEYVSYVENNLNLPSGDVHWVLANHDYKLAGSWDMSSVYSGYGYASLSETYFSKTYGDLELIVLNNAHRTTDHTSDRGQMEFVDGSIDWLEGQLNANNRPKLVVMHHPVVPTTGLKYDIVNIDDVVYPDSGSNRVRRLVDSDPNVLGTIFGHVHHERMFDKVLEARPGHFHICGPNEFMNGTAVNAHALVDWVNKAGGGTGRLTADYQGMSGWRTSWPLPSTAVEFDTPRLFDDFRDGEFTGTRTAMGNVQDPNRQRLHFPDWDDIGAASPTGNATEQRVEYSPSAADDVILRAGLPESTGHWSFDVQFLALGTDNSQFQFYFVYEDGTTHLKVNFRDDNDPRFFIADQDGSITGASADWTPDTSRHRIDIVRDEGGAVEAILDGRGDGETAQVFTNPSTDPVPKEFRIAFDARGTGTEFALYRAESTDFPTWV